MKNPALRIFVIPGTYNYSNIGDTAMLYVCLRRLKKLFPFAEVTMFSLNEEYIKKKIPYIRTVATKGRNFWVSYRLLFNPLSRMLPRGLSNFLVNLQNRMRISFPSFFLYLVSIKEMLFYHGYPVAESKEFIDCILKSDLVVVSGMGGLHDGSDGYFTVFKILELAIVHKIPTALFGQGIGPINNQELFERAKSILNRVDLISIRERRASLPCLLSLGVKPEKIFVTGDDAVELAYEYCLEKRDFERTAIGVGIRVASMSEITIEDIALIKRVIHKAAEELNVRLLPIPIMIDSDKMGIADYVTLKTLLEENDDNDIGLRITEPEHVISQISNCRIVVAGSYHSSVLSLSQGIPTVGFAKTEYYANKLLGVASEFGNICKVVILTSDTAEQELYSSIVDMWKNSPNLKDELLKYARIQVESGISVYSKISELLM